MYVLVVERVLRKKAPRNHLAWGLNQPVEAPLRQVLLRPVCRSAMILLIVAAVAFGSECSSHGDRG